MRAVALGARAQCLRLVVRGGGSRGVVGELVPVMPLRRVRIECDERFGTVREFLEPPQGIRPRQLRAHQRLKRAGGFPGRSAGRWGCSARQSGAEIPPEHAQEPKNNHC